MLRPTRNPFVLLQRPVERGFERLRLAYQLLLTTFVYRRFLFVPAFLALCVAGALLLFPWLGQDFFPVERQRPDPPAPARPHRHPHRRDRAPERSGGSVDPPRRFPPSELDSIVDNMGLPYSGINTTYNTSGVIGSADADILVSLKEGRHRPTAEWVRHAAAETGQPSFPATMFYFLPADMITQILNFGLPAPIDVQVEGADVARQPRVRRPAAQPDSPGARAWWICACSSPSTSPSCTSRWIAPKREQAGFTQFDIAGGMLVSLSGSFQTTPTFYLNPKNGVNL